MTTTSQVHLFTPIQLGALVLKHRVVMPALSRLRAEWPSAVPSALMLEHYSQRASDGGLIITESTAIAPEARAYHTAPGFGPGTKCPLGSGSRTPFMTRAAS